MHLEKLLKEAFPHLDTELVENAAREVLNGKCDVCNEVTTLSSKDDQERIAELEAELTDHRREISRLNTIIVNQRAGFENASPAALGILAERARQKRMEGYGDNHDDEHSDFELSRAAAAYLIDAIERARGGEGQVSAPTVWPWLPEDWKRKQIYRQLEIVGALVIAEQERLGRNGLDVI